MLTQLRYIIFQPICGAGVLARIAHFVRPQPECNGLVRSEVDAMKLAGIGVVGANPALSG